MTGYIECRLAGAYKRTALRSVSFRDRKSTRLNSSHLVISYAVFCLKKKIPPSHRFLATCYPHLGRLDQAHANVPPLRPIPPVLVRNALPHPNAADREPYLSGPC